VWTTVDYSHPSLASKLASDLVPGTGMMLSLSPSNILPNYLVRVAVLDWIPMLV
jgi:hypothetical protein